MRGRERRRFTRGNKEDLESLERIQRNERNVKSDVHARACVYIKYTLNTFVRDIRREIIRDI